MLGGCPRLSIDLSIVVPTCNKASYLDALLASIARQTMSGRRFEVIVVNDGSTDRTRDVVESHAGRIAHLDYCHQDNAGVASARNTGIHRARGDLIAFLADDYVLPEDYCEKMVAHFADPGVDAIKPRARTGGSGVVERAALHLYETSLWRQLHDAPLPTVFTISHLRFPRERTAFRGRCDWSGAAMMRRSLFDRFGHFDPAFKAGEDAEMGARLHQHGVRMHLCPDVFVAICFRSGLLSSLRRAYTYGAHAHRASKGSGVRSSRSLSNPLRLLGHALQSIWLSVQIGLHTGRARSAIVLHPYILAHILVYRLGYASSMASRVDH